MRFIPSLDTIEVEPLYLENADVRTTIEAINTGDFQSHALKWYRQNPRKGIKFLEIFNSMFEELPASGILLRRSVLVILVSFLEQLFLDLFAAYYTLHLKLEQSATNFKPNEYSDQDNDPEIDLPEAQEWASKCMRGGIGERIKRLEAIGVDCSLLTEYQSEIQEIVKRRNLFVHKDGVVDQNYLDHIPFDEVTARGFSIGRRLVVSTAYLQHAIEITTIYGLLLHQICWREWVQVKHSKADEVLIILFFMH